MADITGQGSGLRPVTFSFRPLTGGMRRQSHPGIVEPGQFLDIQNGIVGTKGIQRSPGVLPVAGSESTSYPPVEGFAVVTGSDGSERLFVLDQKFCYEATYSSIVVRYTAYTTGTARTSGTYVIGSGTSWVTEKLQPGDVLKIGSGSSLEYLELLAVDTNTVARTVTTPAFTHPNQSYEIRKAFLQDSDERLDWTSIDKVLVLTDGKRPPWKVSNTVVLPFASSLTSADVSAKAVCYHADRLWLGNIRMGSAYYPHRIMWSGTIDHTNFGTIGATQFVDRPYSPGHLVRILPLGAYLVAYYEDAIDFGRPTNIAGDSLPFGWERLGTGGIGLIGQRAVCNWVEGQFFVSRSGAYFLSLNQGIQRIDQGLLDAALEACQFPHRIQVAFDPAYNRIVFAVPRESNELYELYSLQLDTKSWSREEVIGTAIEGVQFRERMTIEGLDSLSSTIEGLDSVSRTIAGLDGGSVYHTLILGTATGGIYRYSASSDRQVNGELVRLNLETPDWDFGVTDRMKSVYRLSIRVDTPLVQPGYVIVRGYANSGDSFVDLGTLTIQEGTREGFLNFQITGSTIRLVLFVNIPRIAYTVLEYDLRVKGRGIESYFSA